MRATAWIAVVRYEVGTDSDRSNDAALIIFRNLVRSLFLVCRRQRDVYTDRHSLLY